MWLWLFYIWRVQLDPLVLLSPQGWASVAVLRVGLAYAASEHTIFEACFVFVLGSFIFHTKHATLILARVALLPYFAFCAGTKVFVGLHLLVTRQEGVLYLKDTGVLVQEIASVRVSPLRTSTAVAREFEAGAAAVWRGARLIVEVCRQIS